MPAEDLGTDVDGSLELLGSEITELPLDAYSDSPVFLSDEESAGLDVMPPDPIDGAVGATAEGPLNCATYTQPVTPIGIYSDQQTYPTDANTRYFSYPPFNGGAPTVLVGVSADVGCLLSPKPNQGDQCNINNFDSSVYAPVDGLLNKTRIWISLGKNSLAPDVSFKQEGDHFRLDYPGELVTGYAPYFERLRQVVSAAKAHHLIVEVTFFAPWEGPLVYTNSPWKRGQAMVPGFSTPQAVGFSDIGYFVINDPRNPATTPDAVKNERMRAFQNNIIQWTVDALWCYDDVYWEISNEPEGVNIDPAYSSRWQHSMIYQVRKAEAAHRAYLSRGHLIAVQPFTTAGVTAFLGAPPPPPPPPAWQPDATFPLGAQILNGHYTIVGTNRRSTLPISAQSQLDVGAMFLVRTWPKAAKLYGFNEGKITSIGGDGATKSHVTDASGTRVEYGKADPARAEAWEFLLTQTSTFDHFGYLGSSVSTIRQQLGALLAFFNSKFGISNPAGYRALRLSDFRPAQKASWVDPGTYLVWDNATQSQKYWSGLETNPLKSPRRAAVFYIHHSTPRCSPDTESYSNGCSGLKLSFNGYDARIRFSSPPASPPMYRENLTLLAPGTVTGSGTFMVDWIDPRTATILRTQTVTCPPSCTLQSPPYEFDILLRIVKQ